MEKRAGTWAGSQRVPLGCGRASGTAVYLGELPVGHEGGQGFADTPLLLRAQVFRDHLDSHLQRERGVAGRTAGSYNSRAEASVRLKSHPGWASEVSTSPTRYGTPGT